MKGIFLLVVLSPAAAAQFGPVKLGVKGGGYFTDWHSSIYSGGATGSGQYAVGPSVEWFIRKDISVEANALFRPYSADSSLFSFFPSAFTAIRAESNSWEVPILVKKYFGNGPVRPFAGIGPNFRRLHGMEITSSRCAGCTSEFQYRANDSSTLGGTVSSGIELPRFGPRWTVEFRYTLYEAKYTGLPGAKLNNNQAGVFLGITF